MPFLAYVRRSVILKSCLGAMGVRRGAVPPLDFEI